MEENSVVSMQVHSYTLVASLTGGVLRLALELNHHNQLIYVQRFTQQQFPPQLQAIFQTVGGFYEYLYKLALKGQSDRVAFRGGLLFVRVLIDDRAREIPIRLRRMREERESGQGQGKDRFMLTSIASEPSQSSRITIASKVIRKEHGLGKQGDFLRTDEFSSGKSTDYPAARLKLMMIKENKMKRAANRTTAQVTSSSATQVIREYPYTKPQTIHRYSHNFTEESRKSQSEPKHQQIFTHSRALSLKKKTKQTNLDLSNKDLKWSDVKEVISYDWSKLLLLNIGYNNIATQGLKLLTSVPWPALKTLYVCFNNITRVQWTASHICFLKTLSLSGNKIKEIPTDITQLEFLQELFIYNNKIQQLPQELLVMEQLRNFSIYGNKLDPQRNKKLISKLKARKVQVWQ